MFWLTKRASDALGLVCDGEGVMLGSAPLVVPAQDAFGRKIFRAARPQRVADVLAAAYGSGSDALGRHLAQLDGIAKALSEGKLAEAAIRAVHLQLPELTAEGARRLARLAKYSPDQPRVPAGEPGGGQWTSEGGASGGGEPVRVAANDTGVMSDAGDPRMRAAAANARGDSAAPVAIPPPPGTGNVREYSPEDAAKLPPPPAGSKYVTLNDGTVLWSAYSNHGHGGPMLMPEDVSFEDNVRLGQRMSVAHEYALRK